MNEIDEILALDEGPVRTAALASWVQGLFDEDEAPVLVGGAAVELYTGGGYSTGDLDFVGSVSQAVADAFESAEFERRGRHWVHEEGRVFIEFPAAALDEGEASVALDFRGYRVIVVEPEALVADRLAAWQAWESAGDAVNAWLVARSQKLDFERVEALSRAKGVSAAAQRLAAALESWRDRDPKKEELVVWAEAIPSE